MNRDIIPLFSTPLYQTILEVEDCENESFLNSVKSLNYVQCFDELGNLNGSISEEQNVLNLPTLKKLKNLIENELSIFLYDCIKIDKTQSLRHVCSWAVKHGYKDKSHRHSHNNSLFSGVYYLKVPENSGNFLKFHSNSEWKTVDPSYTEFNLLNSNVWDLEIHEKKLILFPSNLPHSVPVSKSTEDRYSIAFNYFLSGKFGVNTSNLFL